VATDERMPRGDVENSQTGLWDKGLAGEGDALEEPGDHQVPKTSLLCREDRNMRNIIMFGYEIVVSKR